MTTPNMLEVIREDSNMPTTTCPSREMYLQYTRGLVSEEELKYLADHLDSCPDCQDVVMTLDDADDTVVGRLRMPLSGESFLAEPQLERALAAAIAMPIPRPNAKGGLDVEDESVSDMPETLGEYQLLEELGHGGMGRVYKALQTKLDRVVALKILPRGRVGDRQAINRFEREMKAVGRLAHPNIVQAYDAREIDDMPVLIMEFVDGLDLADIVRRVGTVPVAEACELVRRTALALQCAHEHGLVHRDIKPSNIMLSRSGEVKLLDLGLARFYAEGGAAPAFAGEEMTGTGQAMGTADYMAPEQASDSRTVDIRADIYSLGCTFYKLLSGRAPFSGPEYRSTLDKLNAHVHQPVPPVRNFVPDVPEELAAILDRMLAKDPGDRFATPAEVAAALEPFCHGAELANLMVRAMAAESRPSHGEGESEGQVPLDERALERDSSPRFHRPILRRILIGMGFLGAMAAAFAAGIVITIKMNGEEYQVKPPANSRTDIDNKGNVNVSIPGEPESARPSTTNASVEAKALQGRWRVVRVEKGENADAMLTRWVGFDGSHESPTNLGYGYLEFADGFLRNRDYTKIQDSFYIYKIDPIPATKTIDLTVPRSGAEGPYTMLGIYEIDGEHLRLRLTRRLAEVKSEQRPTQFALERGSGDILILLNRYHPSDDEKAIQGQWKVIGRTEDGKPASAESLQYLKGSCGDEGFVIGSYTPGMVHSVLWGPYVLDAAKNPRTITIHDNVVRKPEDGQIMESKQELFGIYKFENDRLQIAYRRDGPRPEKFESTPGSGVTLLVLERPKPPSESGAETPKTRSSADAGASGGTPASRDHAQAAVATPNAPDEAKQPVVRTYRVTGISPDSALKVLQPIFAGAPDVRLTEDAKNGNLIAVARPAQHDVIQAVLKEICSPRTIRFKFKFEPWKDVLPWVAQQAELTLDPGETWPEGTFNYTDNREFTPDEAIDLLNGVLLSKKYTLLRFPGTLKLVSLNHGSPSKAPPSVDESMLDKRGDHEWVSVTLHARKSPEELKRLTPLLSPGGAWTCRPIGTDGSLLVVTDIASHVRQVLDEINKMQATTAKPDAPKPAPAGLPEVTVVHPIVRQITQHADFNGHLEAAQTAEVQARVTGHLAKIHFQPGALVKQGDLLFELDSAPFQAELDKREADVRALQLVLDQRKKQIKDLKAPAPSDRQELEGYQAAAQAELTAAQERSKVAKLNLASTRLTAPIGGTIGRSLISIGSLLTDNKPLATIDSVDPMCVAFDVDQGTLLKIRRNPPRVSGESALPVLVGLSDEKGFPHKSKVESADTRMDPATGTARWRALLPNPDGLLMPGMFVRVRLVTSDPYTAMLVPPSAIFFPFDLEHPGQQPRPAVFIVTDQNVLHYREIKTGDGDNDGMQVVEKGLTADDWVVEKGRDYYNTRRLADGVTVNPKKPMVAVPPSSSQDNLPATGPAAELKVYGGKSFDQWRELARTDLDSATRVKAFQALGAFADSGKSSEVLTAIIDALKVDQQPDALKAAYTALRLTGPQGEATIISAIRDEDPAHRLAAIRAMAFGNSSRDTYAIPALIEALDDPNPTVRTYICSALANIAVATERASRVRPEGEFDPTINIVIPVLSRLLRDADSGVRNVTVQAMDRMGALPNASIPDLIAYVEATVKAEPEMSRRHISSVFVLSRVLRVLGHMGPAASSAVPLLTQIKQPGVMSFPIERAAEDALFEIQGGKPRPRIKPDSVHPDTAKPGEPPSPQSKGGHESAEK